MFFVSRHLLNPILEVGARRGSYQSGVRRVRAAGCGRLLRGLRGGSLCSMPRHLAYPRHRRASAYTPRTGKNAKSSSSKNTRERLLVCAASLAWAFVYQSQLIRLMGSWICSSLPCYSLAYLRRLGASTSVSLAESTDRCGSRYLFREWSFSPLE